ncbi:MAG TPA: type VII secretion integral membrane protein EccD [Streptosporangiaceae bacterium]|jgi:type VII secretion integral membrane protein EccD
MADFSRVTLVSERRRVDAVLPSDEPIGRLLPDVLLLVGDPVETPPRLRHLVTVHGDVLPGEGTLAGAGVPDGAVLTLVRAGNAPPPPVVHDVTEETADDADVRGWRWGPAARRWTSTVAVAVLLLVAGLLLRAIFDSPAEVGLLIVVAAVLVLTGGALGRFVTEPVGTALTLGGGAVGVLAAQAAADAYDWASWVRWSVSAFVVAALLAFLGVTSPLGRGGIIGAAFAALLGAGWAVAAGLDLSAPRLAAVMSVAVIVALGLLPRLALSASGLAALDDRRSTGVAVARYDVETALSVTHRGLVIATVATAVSAALAGYLLARFPDHWTVPLALLVAAVLAARSRAFPLAAEVVALLIAAAVVLLALLGAWVSRSAGPPWAALAAVAAVAVVPLGVLSISPPEHVRVRLRRTVDRFEAAAVIAVVPVALGVFGTYGRLLHVF